MRPELAGFELDLNIAHKWQIDADAGEDADAWEFTADITRAIGPAEAGVQIQHSPDGTGDTQRLDLGCGQRGLGVHRQAHRRRLSGPSRTGRQCRLHRLERRYDLRRHALS